MRIRAKFVGTPYTVVGTSDMWLLFDKDQATMADLLTQLERERGLKLNLQSDNIIVLINGRRMEFVGGLQARLKDLDEVVIASFVGGG